jgi:hypothetical protein
MKERMLILILVTMGLFSCKQDNKSTQDTADIKTLNSVKNTENKKQSVASKVIYTKYEYKDSKGASLIIENSLPKGGKRYTDPNGHEYVYAVFWTRIINETTNPLELKIDFPPDSYEIPSLPGKYYKTLIPSDTMTTEKIPLFNYGLTNLDPFFDKNIDKPSSLKRTINPKESSAFYIVALRLIGGDQYDVLRTELNLKGQNLFYKIRDKEIQCGSINLKNLTLQK